MSTRLFGIYPRGFRWVVRWETVTHERDLFYSVNVRRTHERSFFLQARAELFANVLRREQEEAS